MKMIAELVDIALLLGLDASVIIALVSGIIIPVLGFIGSVIYKLHKRLVTIEKESETREKVVYGGENNPLNLGLVKEIKSLKKEFREYEKRQNELQDKKDELSERIQALEEKVQERE